MIGEEAVAVGVMEALRREDAVVATYREHGQAMARGIGMDRLMAEMFGKQEGCCRGRGGSMHIFDRATRFYGGNAIVGGGLPLAVGIALGRQDAGPQRCHRLLFRRWCGRRGRVPREHEPRRAVAPAGAVRVREQPLRDGDGAGAGRGRDRHRPQGRRISHAGRRRSTAWTSSRSRARRGAPSKRSAPAAGRNSSNAAHTGSARIRCSTPNSTARRTEIEAWRKKGTDRRASSAGCMDSGLIHDEEIRRIEAEADAEIEAAVAFAEAGTLGAGRGARALRVRWSGSPS